nr:class I SAM-dependent methyltransferase [uncultured Rhodoferax sp.]
MTYFANPIGAERYDRFRPKVHTSALEWLAATTGPCRYRNALDVACGTGESTKPLLSIADVVEGVDSSFEMVSHARAKGLQVSVAAYDNLPSRKYDLLTVCMAFHWFDRSRALNSFAQASEDSATWFIYNFAFAGHSTDDEFNHWLRSWYYVHFPSPARKEQDFRVRNEDKGLVELAHESGAIVISLDRAGLIGYLTTQSNVEAKVQAGSTYESIERQIDASMPETITSEFRYAYTYTVVSFNRG